MDYKVALVDVDRQFTAAHLRDTLERYLGIESIFPCFCSPNTGSTAQCMLKIKPGDENPSVTWCDRVFCKLIWRVSNDSKVDTGSTVNVTSSAKTIKSILGDLYEDIPFIYVHENETYHLWADVKPKSLSKTPGLSRILKIVLTPAALIFIQGLSLQNISTICKFHSHSSLNFPTFSRGFGVATRDIRLRFIAFQLLQTTKFIHSLGLCLDPLDSTCIELDEDLWVVIRLLFSSRMILTESRRKAISRRPSARRSGQFTPLEALITASVTPEVADSDDELDTSHVERLSSQSAADEYFESMIKKLTRTNYVDKPPGYDIPITLRWIEGKISNFEYIMAINVAAGRQLSDVLHHPVLPWVTNFSVDPTQGYYNSSALRDLTKSKFRLTKGDKQLETTYLHSEPPHHIPEILAELTYMIYMARRVPMHLLLKVVRAYFDPTHYPHSMARMYEWSPDECIPEFYMDTSVFSSIHKNVALNDIELPDFAPTPEQFIHYHRSILESNHVSAHLHSWIDLTFGSFLSGQEAIDNLNVPLQHSITAKENCGGSPDFTKHPGFVVLFDKPHPKRRVAENYDDAIESFYVSSSQNAEGLKREVPTDRSMLQYSSLKNEPVASSIGSTGSYVPFSGLSLNIDDEVSGFSGNEPNGMSSSLGSAAMSSSPSSNGGILTSTDIIGAAVNVKSEQLNGSVTERLMGANERSSLRGGDADGSQSILRMAKSIKIQTKEDRGVMDELSISRRHIEDILFSQSVSAELEPANVINFMQTPPANPLVTSSSSSKSDNNPADADSETVATVSPPRHKRTSDELFFESLQQLEGTLPNHQVSENFDCNNESLVRHLQSLDMVSIGMLLWFMFSGKPLFSLNESIEFPNKNMDINILRCKLYDHSQQSSIPITVKRLLIMIFNPNLVARPTAHEIISSCMMADKSSPREEESFLSPPILHTINEKQTNSEEGDPVLITTRNSSIARCEFMKDMCGCLFPSYFQTVYSFILRLKSAKNGSLKIKHLLLNLDVIDSLPLDGINIILPHVLTCIKDPEPFLESANEMVDASSRPTSVKMQLISEYHKIFEALASRIGISATAVVIVPEILHFLENLRSPALLRRVIMGHLPQTLLKRAGTRCFLRQILPLLITWMISGNLLVLVKNRRKSLYNTSYLPLWASSDDDSFEVSEWLIRTAKQAEIQDIQEAAVAAISALTSSSSLGPGLCLRFVLPAVLCLICNPSLAAAGYYTETLAFQNRKYESGSDKSNPVVVDLELPDEDGSVSLDEDVKIGKTTSVNIERLNEIIDALSTYDAQHMYAVRALEGICSQAGVLATVELVLPHLMQNICLHVEKLVSASPIVSTQANACILELMQTIFTILPQLSPTVVVNTFLTRQKSGFCLLNLLLTVPIPRCHLLQKKISISIVTNEDGVLLGQSNTDFNELLQFFRSYRAFLEICRMVTTLAVHVGAALALEHIVPVVDKFFGNFVSTFSGLPVMSAAMSHAFNIGVQLFIPLVQLIGPEAFSTAAANINPRLEMWLMSSASGIIGRSPPLPSNILPEVVSESEKKIENRESRVAKFFQWMSPSPSTEKREAPNTPSRPFPARLNNESRDVGSAQLPREISDLNVAAVSPVAAIKKKDFERKDSIEDSSIESGSNHFNNNYNNDNSFFDEDVCLGISPRLQQHVRRESSDSATWKIKKTFGIGKRNNKNIFQELRDETSQISLGGMYNHMSGVDPSEYDGAWLLTGVHRWRPSDGESGLSNIDISRDIKSVSNSLKSKLAQKDSKPGSVSNSGLANNVGRFKRATVPAAQLSMTSPKITVDTASEAGSIFSLQMTSKVHFYPDEIGVPVQFMMTNETESLLVTGHKNGRVKIWNLNSHPLSSTGIYNGHLVPPIVGADKKDALSHTGVFCGSFMKDSCHAFTCDGTIRIWDVETQKTLAELSPNTVDQCNQYFTHCESLSPKEGVIPDIGPHGDNVLMACMGQTLYHFDVRMRTTNVLSSVAEWRLPIPTQSSTGNSDAPKFSSSTGNVIGFGGNIIGAAPTAVAPHLTCSISHNNIIYTGTSLGYIFSLDRRSGKPIVTWQGHGGPVLKLFPLEKHHLLSVSDKSARIWEHQKGKLKLMQPIKGLPESSLGMNANTIILNTYDQMNSFSEFSKPIYALYCLSGHKMCAGRIPITTNGEFVDKMNLAQINKETDDTEEIRLKKSYFTDKSGAMISKQKLQIHSAVLLPLRQLMLLGAEDGLLRVIS